MDQLATSVILLALPPAGVIALALLAARGLPPSERGLLAAAAVLFIASASLSPHAAIHDQWTHFVHVRAALARPERLLDAWDRPGFALLYAGPAAFGLTAARLASVPPALLSLAATMRAARLAGASRPWAAGLLLLAQYDFFGQASSTMTELPFAAALAVALWGWWGHRPWVAAAGLGWAAITRPEGPLFAALGAAGLLARDRRAVGPALAALAPFGLYLALGAALFRDPLWWIHDNPYRGLVGPRLELAQLSRSFFFEALRRGQPPVLIGLEAAGAALAIVRSPRLRPALGPVALSFALLTFLRIGESDAWLDSRYLVTIAPVLAVLAAAGLDRALEASPRFAPPALLALAAFGAAGQLRWSWRLPLAEVPWAGPALMGGLLGLAALLWMARRRVPPRAALAALLVLPLAAAPPGAFGKLRVEPEGATAPRPPPRSTSH